MSTLRLFWAINLPAELKDNLYKEVKEQLKDIRVNLKWVEEENIHLTVHFLGDVSEESIDNITGAVEKVAGGHGPLQLEVKGVGCFPGPKRPKVFWAGIDGEKDKLVNLCNNIREVHGDLGFEPDNKPFSPHLTLARFRSPGNSREFLNKANEIIPSGKRIGNFEVVSLDLMQSTLSRKGPVYKVLYSVKL